MTLPHLALSVRQPWAWAIIHAGKDVENRSAAAVRNMGTALGVLIGTGARLAVHAALGMTRSEYEVGRLWIENVGGLPCPAPHELQRGGIIGSVVISGIVRSSDSRWWMGPCGLVLAGPRPCEFVPAVGALGLFPWIAAATAGPAPPARWMLPREDLAQAAVGTWKQEDIGL